MVQFEVNIKLSTINGKGLNRLIAREETRNSAIAETALHGEGLDAMYAIHLRFIRKPVVVFRLVIELFSLSVMVDVLRANIDSKSAFFKGVGQFRPKFQVGSDILHRPFVHR